MIIRLASPNRNLNAKCCSLQIFIYFPQIKKQNALYFVTWKNTSCFFNLLWPLQQKSRQILPDFTKHLCTIESLSSRLFLKQNFTYISFSVVPNPGKFVNSRKFDVIVTSLGLMECQTLFPGTKIVIQSRKMLWLT